MPLEYRERVIESENATPPDLRRWVDEPTLVGLVLEAVADLEVCDPEAESFSPGAPVRSKPMMLTLLTFCYLTGRYGSEQIESLTRSDGMARYLCGNDLPDWTAIRRFRRANHEMLGLCLYEVLKAAWRRRARAANRLAAEEAIPPATREGLTQSAEEYLRRAMLADCMAMDV